MTPTHWGIVFGSLILSSGLTWLVKRFATQRNLSIQAPRDRDVHTKPVPRLGGVAVGVTFMVVTLVTYWVRPDLLQFFDGTILGIDRNLFGILAGVFLLMLVGVIDDIRGLSPWSKLLFHFLAGIILAWSSVLIFHVTNPLGGTVQLGVLGFVLVVGWVVFMINVINFLDGLDGLASGISLIATIVLFFLATKPEVNQLSMSVLALILTGALLGFLPFNFYPAKIFLGDSGSQVLGFLLAVFAIISGGKLATAFLVLGVPILDVVWVVSRRVLTGHPIYKADRFHLHHRLLRAGLKQREAVLLLYTVSAAFGIIALQTQSMGKLVASLILLGIMIVGGAGLVALDTFQTKKSQS